MTLAEVELCLVRLPLVRPFVTGTGTSSHKEAIVVRVRTADGVAGLGECPSEPTPTYSPEHTEGCWITLREHLAPRALRGQRLDAVRGNHLARSALEVAILDAELRQRGVSLAAHLGGVRDRVEAGVVVELHEDPAAAAAAAAARVGEGYRRIKLKIAPGRDRAQVAAVRAAVGEVPLWVDANGAYRPEDRDLLASLDVDLLEQPLAAGDLLDHAELRQHLEVPVCLDESLRSPADARMALHVHAADVWSVKPAAVGGLAATVAIHDLAVAGGVPLWCGGLLETGIGRAANLAVASMPGMVLPGDLSASARYFDRDLTEPFELGADGCLAVPARPGLGIEVDEEWLAAVTVRRERLTPASVRR